MGIANVIYTYYVINYKSNSDRYIAISIVKINSYNDNNSVNNSYNKIDKIYSNRHSINCNKYNDNL